MKVTNLNLLFFLLLLSACLPEEQQNTVVVETQGVEEKPSVIIENNGDLGEFLIDSEIVDTKIVIKNNSKFNIFDISVKLEKSFESNADMVFAENELNESIYPGNGGSCQSELEPNEECEIVLSFNPDRRGDFYQKIQISYKNMIDEMKINLLYRAYVGEFASIGVVGDSSIFSFGVLDKAEVIGKGQNITIVNNGGLTAENIYFEMINGTRVIDAEGNENITEVDTGFFIESHNCPKRLRAGQSCQLKINYSNSNLLLDDPSLFYDGILKLNYVRDNEGRKGSLTLNFGFTSSAIEARFIFSGLTSNLSFSQIVTGTKSSIKIIEVQNDGFKEGALKSFKFYDQGNRLIADCSEYDPETMELICLKTGGNSADLSELPFKIYDKNSSPCLGRLLGPKGVGSAGEKCFFHLLYWPSTKFEELASGNINKVILTAEYDSRLENRETIKQNYLSNISYSFKKPALLKITSLKRGSETVEPDANYESQNNSISQKFGQFDHSTDSFYPLGRLSLVNASGLGEKVTIRVKNFGEEIAQLTKISDSQYFSGGSGVDIPFANEEGSVEQDIMSLFDNSKKTFYQNVKTTCKEFLAVGNYCEISFYLDLKKQFPISSDNSVLFFDHQGNLSLNAKDFPFKQFNIYYNNGAEFNDDGSPYEEKRTVSRISASLINKGVLKFSNTLHWMNLKKFSFSDVDKTNVYGNESFFDIYVTNVGTNDISYMAFGESDNLNRNNSNDCSGASSALQIVDITASELENTVLLSSDYEGGENIFPDRDCYDAIDYQEKGFLTPSGNDINILSPLVDSKRSALREGESCVMRVKIKSNVTHPNCFSPHIYENIADKELTNDYGIAKFDSIETILQTSFSTSPEPNVGYDDQLKFLPPLRKYSYIASPAFIYFDGDVDFPIPSEYEVLGSNNIFGERKILSAAGSTDDLFMKMFYQRKTNIYVTNLMPIESTLLMFNEYGVRYMNDAIDFFENYPDTYVPSMLSPQIGISKGVLDEIFQENIDFHRSSLSPSDDNPEWEIFLGSSKNETKYFNFQFLHSGFDGGKIKKCELKSDDVNSANFNASKTEGIIPSSEFVANLNNFGCDFNPLAIDKTADSIGNLSRLLTDDFLLKFSPGGADDSEYFFSIILTIEDSQNPNNSADLPTREITFNFRTKELKENSTALCFSTNGNCASNEGDISFNSLGKSDEIYTLEAAKGQIDSKTIEIYNPNAFAVTPKILFKDQVGSFLESLPSAVSYTAINCAELSAAESCELEIEFTPFESSVTSQFDLVIAYESANPGENEGVQRDYKSISFDTNILENGIIKPYKLVAETGECGDTPLPVNTIVYNRDGVDLEVKAINIDIGDRSFDTISDGIYKKFCIKNPKTLPILVWDVNDNWTPETIFGVNNMVKVSNENQGGVEIYVEEKCMLKSLDSSGVLKEEPEGGGSFGIMNNDSCVVVARYLPSASEVNNEINSANAAIDYFSNTPQGSESPSLLMGLTISGFILSPDASPNPYSEGIERSIYEIQTNKDTAVIQWNEFTFDDAFGYIEKYLVYVDELIRNVNSDALIVRKSTNASLANCVVNGGSTSGNYQCIINGLNSSSRYYVRVIPLINYLGTSYVGFDHENKNVHAFFTGPINDNMAYEYLNNIYIDKVLISEVSEFDKNDALLACTNQSIEILLNENNLTDVDKDQVGLDEWALILSDIDKYNVDEDILRVPILLKGVVARDFEGVELENSGSPEVIALGGEYYYVFKWSGSLPEEFNIATLGELPVSLEGIPDYGSLFLFDSVSTPFNTRCFTPLPE